MHNKSFYICLLAFLLAISCKPSTEKQTETAAPATTYTDSKDLSRELKVMKNMNDKLGKVEVEVMISEANRILAHRQNENPKPNMALTTPVWQYEFVFGGSDESKVNELAGRWIDFSDDLTYTYGHYETIEGGGKYHMDETTEKLLMLDNSAVIKPNEYKVQIFPAAAILQGTSVYKDNNYQCKLKRLDSRPTSPSE